MAAEEQQSAGVEELYKNFGVLADAGEKAGEVGNHSTVEVHEIFF